MKNLRTYETCVGTRGALYLRAGSNAPFKTAFRALVIGVMAVGFVPLASASQIGDLTGSIVTVTTNADFTPFAYVGVVTVGLVIELEGGRLPLPRNGVFLSHF